MTQLNHDDWIALAGLRAIARRQPVTVDELVLALRVDLGRAGLVPEHRVDEILVSRDLVADWLTEGLEEAEYAPADVDHLGRPRRRARRGYSLTVAGGHELRRLERLAGVLV